jgi:2-polyprenyl-3-methyl-5-hydroxy-6-metoxy-1,4-benzoquinol methylase
LPVARAALHAAQWQRNRHRIAVSARRINAKNCVIMVLRGGPALSLNDRTRSEPKTALQDMEVHDTWSRDFRTPENAPFFDLAFDHIARRLGPPGSSPVLDAGCGSGTKSLLLAGRGYSVIAVDFSVPIVEAARRAVLAAGFDSRIRVEQGDLTALALASGSTRRIVCWGVLMHIPAVHSAVAELARVLEPGGVLVISEANLRSVQATVFRWLRRLLGRRSTTQLRTPAGVEFWESTASGRVMTRQADIAWLVGECRQAGLELLERRAGQFTELYTMLPLKALRRLVHAFNNFWFTHVRFAGPAFGNLLVFVKR